MTIPYEFTTIPTYFRDNGYYKNPLMRMFIYWAFERCNTKKHFVFINKKEIELDPLEFIFGLETCSDETGLSIQNIRSILKDLTNRQVLSKVTGKCNNKFSVYRWSKEHFIKKEKELLTGKKIERQQQIREYINNNINIVISPTALPMQNSFVMNLPTNSKIIPIDVMFQKPQNIPECKKIPSTLIETIKSPEKKKTQETKPKACKKNYFDRKTQKFSDIDKKLMDYWREKFPRIHLEYQFERMTEWLKEHPSRKGTQAFITNWLKKAETWRHNQELNRDPERFKLLNETKEQIPLEQLIAQLSVQEREEYERLYKYN